MAEGSLEAEVGGTEAAATPRLTELIRGFDKPNRRMLLVLDEAQVLAESAHTDLAHSLRASLDGRKQNIKVVFAGSSEATLCRMFGRTTEPFCNWAPLEPFELLGEEFVRAMVAKVNRLSRYPLAQKNALSAFSSLKRTPEFFRRYLSRYLTYADLGTKAALLDTEAHVFNDANFVTTWHRLLPADRELLPLIVSGITDLFSESSRRRQDADLVLRMDYGDYRVQDDALAEWLRNQELEN